MPNENLEPLATRRDLIKIVREIDPNVPNYSKPFESAILLLAIAFGYPPRIQPLLLVSNFKVSQIRDRLKRMKEQGIIERQNGEWKVCVNWLDEESGIVAFWMDVNCVEGLVDRVRR